MVVLEIVKAIAEFNIGFFIDLILNNLLWLFMFITIAYFTSKKNFIATLFFVIFVPITTLEFFNKLINFSIYTATGLFFVYILRLFVLTILANSGNEKYVPIAYVVIFYIIVAWLFFWS